MQIVFTDLMNKRLYITGDEGVTYRKEELDITPYIIKFIPSSAPWLKDGDYAKLAFVHDYDTKKVTWITRSALLWRLCSVNMVCLPLR